MRLSTVGGLFFWILLFAGVVFSEIQSFSKAPKDTEILEGETATLPCRVSNQAGFVQWSKNGVLLGFDRRIPGYPRYHLKGNASLGEYDLNIENTTLEDEADFECQVGPVEGHEAISAKIHLTILVSPVSIEIVGQSNNSVIQIKIEDSLSLNCEVKGGKPAPSIVWRRNSFRLSEDDVRMSVKDEENSRQTAVSTLNISPTPDDNKAYYSCESSTLYTSETLTAGVSLDVLSPPGKPSVEGYRARDKIRAGDTVTLRCVSRGGNPLARLVWTKNGEFIDHSYTTSDWEAENVISLTASSTDDGAAYTCTATSIMTPEPMQRSVKLKVLYAPASVKIKAPKEAKPGDVISATCKTEKSNPAADITWIVDGIPLLGDNSVEAKESGGWITTSKIQVNVTQQDRNAKLFTCYAVNQELGETIPQSSSVSILYAPDSPNIFGYGEGTAIHAGKLQRLTCISHGGNPLPDLKWFKGDKELTGSQQSTSGNIVSKELAIVTEASDNGAKYQCKSTSKALSDPLVAEITLTVYYPPTNLKLKFKPKKPKAGFEANLTCESMNSNPAANITWWKGRKNDLRLAPSSISVSSASENGGFNTEAVYTVEATADDDGSLFTCQATNEAIQQSVHDTIVLSVFYKPIFDLDEPITYDIKENDSCVINATARANPDKVAYRWQKGEKVVEEGSPLLNITYIERSHAGQYTCQAKNDIGESVIAVKIVVLYPAVILKPQNETEGKTVIADPESNIRLECIVDANPVTKETIQWKRDSFDLRGRTEVLSTEDGRSSLSIRNVSRDVSGEFNCIADNGIGTADSWQLVLLVKHKPIIKSTENRTVLSDRGINIQLYCTAEGIPVVNFVWTREGVIISEGDSKTTIDVVKLDHVTWQGILTIENVNAKDFGEYVCVARNKLGFETFQVDLLPDSTPDPPIIVRIFNTSRDALQIMWVPGFGGGHNQTHRIRYKSVLEPAFSYVDVHPPATNIVWISGLKPGLEYEVAMMSINEKGPSLYTTEIVKASTLGGSIPSREKDSSSGLGSDLVEILIGTVGIVFLCLLVFNIVLLALYYHKKDDKWRRKYTDEDMSGSSESISSSKPDSEETTFSGFTDTSMEMPKTESYSFDSISAQYSYTKSEVSESFSDEFEESSQDIEPYKTFKKRQRAIENFF